MTPATATKPQHMVAMDRAQEIRMAQVALKRHVKGQDTRTARLLIANTLDDLPAGIGSMNAFTLLMAGSRIGREVARRHLVAAGIPERKPLRELTDRQRLALAAHLRACAGRATRISTLRDGGPLPSRGPDDDQSRVPAVGGASAAGGAEKPGSGLSSDPIQLRGATVARGTGNGQDPGTDAPTGEGHERPVEAQGPGHTRRCIVCGCTMARACVRREAWDDWVESQGAIDVQDCCSWREDQPETCTGCTDDGPSEDWVHPEPFEPFGEAVA